MADGFLVDRETTCTLPQGPDDNGRLDARQKQNTGGSRKNTHAILKYFENDWNNLLSQDLPNGRYIRTTRDCEWVHTEPLSAIGGTHVSPAFCEPHGHTGSSKVKSVCTWYSHFYM
jgi:hypothetical protein